MTNCVTTCDDETGDVVVETEADTTVVETTADASVVEVACEQGPTGPPGPQGPAGSSGAQKTTVTVAPSDTEVVDSNAVTGLEGLAYTVNVRDTVNGDQAQAFVNVTLITNKTDVSWTVFAKIGDSVAYRVSVAINGSDLELSVTNNGSNSVEVRVLCFPIVTTPT